jgi:hypothetical protein
MAREAPAARRIISATWRSSSLCAILDGRSVANSLGATLQSACFTTTAWADMEAFCLPVLADRWAGMDHAWRRWPRAAAFWGCRGSATTCVLVEEAAAGGNQRAETGHQRLCRRWAVAGYNRACTRRFWADWTRLVFTGGIGLNAAGLRARSAAKLGFLNAALSEARNVPGCEGRISAPESGVEIWSAGDQRRNDGGAGMYGADRMKSRSALAPGMNLRGPIRLIRGGFLLPAGFLFARPASVRRMRPRWFPPARARRSSPEDFLGEGLVPAQCDAAAWPRPAFLGSSARAFRGGSRWNSSVYSAEGDFLRPPPS